MLMVMGGGGVIGDMNKFMKARYSIMQDSKELEIKSYGVTTSFKKNNPHFIDYLHSDTVIRVVANPQLKGNKWGTAAAIFDPRTIVRKYMKADEDGVRKFRQELQIKTPGADVKEGQILFDQGLMIKMQETGGWIQKKNA